MNGLADPKVRELAADLEANPDRGRVLLAELAIGVSRIERRVAGRLESVERKLGWLLGTFATGLVAVIGDLVLRL